MIRNPERLLEWERLQPIDPPDYERNLLLFEGMYRLALTLGALRPGETDLRRKIAMVKALHVRVDPDTSR